MAIILLFLFKIQFCITPFLLFREVQTFDNQILKIMIIQIIQIILIVCDNKHRLTYFKS